MATEGGVENSIRHVKLNSALPVNRNTQQKIFENRQAFEIIFAKKLKKTVCTRVLTCNLWIRNSFVLGRLPLNHGDSIWAGKYFLQNLVF